MSISVDMNLINVYTHKNKHKQYLIQSKTTLHRREQTHITVNVDLL